MLCYLVGWFLFFVYTTFSERRLELRFFLLCAIYPLGILEGLVTVVYEIYKEMRGDSWLETLEDIYRSVRGETEAEQWHRREASRQKNNSINPSEIAGKKSPTSLPPDDKPETQTA